MSRQGELRGFTLVELPVVSKRERAAFISVGAVGQPVEAVSSFAVARDGKAHGMLWLAGGLN